MLRVAVVRQWKMEEPGQDLLASSYWNRLRRYRLKTQGVEKELDLNAVLVVAITWRS